MSPRTRASTPRQDARVWPGPAPGTGARSPRGPRSLPQADGTRRAVPESRGRASEIKPYVTSRPRPGLGPPRSKPAPAPRLPERVRDDVADGGGRQRAAHPGARAQTPLMMPTPHGDTHERDHAPRRDPDAARGPGVHRRARERRADRHDARPGRVRAERREPPALA